MEDKTSIILYQWQTCVEMANSISQRRDSMNNLMVTVNLALIAAVSITWDIKSFMMCVAGIASSIVWILFIRYFKRLNKAKYDVIISLEKKLPEKPFSDEWEKVKSYKSHKDGTWLETIMPIVFIIMYGVLTMLLFNMRGVIA